MRRSSNYQRNLVDVLESDDELTNDYVETPYVPAYKDDNRFEYLEKKKNTESSKQKAGVGDLPLNAIFNMKDALCIQKVPKDTRAWFYKFLLYKDLQANYKYLQSCLVPHYEGYLKSAVCNKGSP